jgi:hypothetical protein
MNPETSNLLSRLVSDTQLHRVQWSCSNVNNEYKLELKTGTLLIRHELQWNSYSLSFFRGTGDNQIICMCKPGDADYHLLAQLYLQIKNSFSSTVSVIMSELSSIEKSI